MNVRAVSVGSNFKAKFVIALTFLECHANLRGGGLTKAVNVAWQVFNIFPALVRQKFGIKKPAN